MTPPATESLRARLLRRVLLPLALVSGLSGAAVLTVAWNSTAQALDRSLLDDAYAIAAHVKPIDGHVVLDLTEREVGTALFDHRERLYFAVHTRASDGVGHGAVVAGQAQLQPVMAGPGAWAFGDRALEGEPLRTVTLRREGPRPFSVTVAQTTHERTRWLTRLAAFALLPQLVLLLMLGWWLGRSILQELAPLARLQRAVESRDTADLAPLDVGAPPREIASLTRALNALMGRVADGVTAQREFAGNVAHELRTPLAGIRALAAYGLKQDAPAVWRTQLEGIAASEARASRLVEQLLALAYADEARDGLPMGPLVLDDVVRDTVLRHLPAADAQGTELGASGLDGSDGPVSARGHVTLIEGVISNLVHNALRHGRPVDGRQATISVDLAATGREVSVAVTDNGPGITAAERQTLLQRWSRSDHLAPREGFGLGLAIAARYAALMGGRLDLREAPGGGLSAVLLLTRE